MSAPLRKPKPGSVPVAPQPDLAAIARQRLKQVGNLAGLRLMNCQQTPCLPGWLRVIANAIKIRDAVAPSANAIRAHVPGIDADCVTDDMLDVAASAAVHDKKLLTNERAGVLVGLLATEAWALAGDDIAVSIWPMDETEDERTYRRAVRRREMAARRQKKLRDDRKARAVNVATRRNARITSSVTARCNIRQPDAVLAAIRGGASAPAEIAEVAGLPLKTIRPLLSRLLKAGKLVSEGRGRYAAVEPEPAAVAASTSPLVATEHAATAMTTALYRLAALTAPVAHLGARLSALTQQFTPVTTTIRRIAWPAAA